MLRRTREQFNDRNAVLTIGKYCPDAKPSRDSLIAGSLSSFRTDLQEAPRNYPDPTPRNPQPKGEFHHFAQSRVRSPASISSMLGT